MRLIFAQTADSLKSAASVFRRRSAAIFHAHAATDRGGNGKAGRAKRVTVMEHLKFELLGGRGHNETGSIQFSE